MGKMGKSSKKRGGMRNQVRMRAVQRKPLQFSVPSNLARSYAATPGATVSGTQSFYGRQSLHYYKGILLPAPCCHLTDFNSVATSTER